MHELTVLHSTHVPTKLMCFNTDSCHNVRIYLNNMPIVNTKHDIHLGNFISCDIYDINIEYTVCDFLSKKSWTNK